MTTSNCFLGGVSGNISIDNMIAERIDVKQAIAKDAQVENQLIIGNQEENNASLDIYGNLFVENNVQCDNTNILHNLNVEGCANVNSLHVDKKIVIGTKQKNEERLIVNGTATFTPGYMIRVQELHYNFNPTIHYVNLDWINYQLISINTNIDTTITYQKPASGWGSVFVPFVVYILLNASPFSQKNGNPNPHINMLFPKNFVICPLYNVPYRGVSLNVGGTMHFFYNKKGIIIVTMNNGSYI